MIFEGEAGKTECGFCYRGIIFVYPMARFSQHFLAKNAQLMTNSVIRRGGPPEGGPWAIAPLGLGGVEFDGAQDPQNEEQ